MFKSVQKENHIHIIRMLIVAFVISNVGVSIIVFFMTIRKYLFSLDALATIFKFA